MEKKPKQTRLPDLLAKKKRGEKITMLTAADANMARLLDSAGIDILLVGDSLGMVVLGYDTTLPVTMDTMVHHASAVSRGAKQALIVSDMPFLSYQISVSEAVRNAGRLLQEGGVAAVKLEGGQAALEAVQRLTSIGIPVMGHLGLQPQSVHQLGGFRRQATQEEDQQRLLADAKDLEKAGAFAVVLESIPAELGQRVTASLQIPTIGIGSGPHCDGQVLVSHDILGLSSGTVPPFAKQYAALGEAIVSAAKAYAEEVQQGRFPG